MNKNIEEKSLIVTNEKNLFHRIKTFFIKLFKGKQYVENENQIEEIKPNNKQPNNTQKDDFVERIRNVENEETKLIKLQKQYDNRLIATKDLTKEQVNALIDMYKKQIKELSINNKKRKEKLLLYKNKIQNT